MSNCCNPVPVLTVTGITLNTTANTATLTASNPLPKSGCFNLRIAGGPRCVNINPCATEQVIVTDGTTLLGADDKAGIAEIMTAIERVISENRPCNSARSPATCAAGTACTSP